MILLKYIGKRLVTILVSLIAIIIITYTLMWLAPGDFFDINRFQAAAGGTVLTSEQVTAMRDGFEAKYGLDQPLWKQIGRYLLDAFRFKFGPAFSSPMRNIEDLIAIKFPVTLALTLLSMMLAIAVGIPLGILAAIRRNSWVDYSAMFFSMLGQVIPSYVAAIVLVLGFCVWLPWFPTSGWLSPWHMVLPVIAIALTPMASIARYMRASLTDILNQDYVRTAYAKGGKDRTVITVHALRNSLIPLVTVLGPQIAFMMTGTVWVEQMFRIPGMGQLFVNAAGARDFPLLVTSTFVLAMTVMIMNLVVDVLYAFLDPRIKIQ
jgi:peptide/nickel transport system permease protein